MRTEFPWGLVGDEVRALPTASANRGKLLLLAILSFCVVASAADYAPPSKDDAQKVLRAAVIETLAPGVAVPAWMGLFGPAEKVELVKADETGIAVRVRGNVLDLKWEKVGEAEWEALGKACAEANPKACLALADYFIALGQNAKADEALTLAVEKHPEVVKEAGLRWAFLKSDAAANSVQASSKAEGGATGAPLWKEHILNSDGKINWTNYKAVADNAGSAEIRDYLLGPKYSFYHPRGGESFPTIALQGDDRGWEGPADKFPQGAIVPTWPPPSANNYYEQSGSLLYVADDPNNAGVILAANGERFDYNNDRNCSFYNKVYWTPPYGWYKDPNPVWLRQPDWNNPKKPTAVASATGHVVNQQYVAFEKGLIGTAAGTPSTYGNNPDLKVTFPCVQLPAGKTPMALAVTPAGEFVLVAVWDTVNRKGQVAVIAVQGKVLCSSPVRDWPNCFKGIYLYGFPTWMNTNNMKL